MNEVVVGLDVGTTAAKASAFALGSTWRSTSVREYPLEHPRPGWSVQDPAAVAAATLSALTQCVTACGQATVAAVSLSSAMHGLLALDDSMTPLTPLLTWADTRADDVAAALRAGPEAAPLYLRSGVPVHAMSPLVKLSWFARHDPALLARARWWVGLKEWLVWTLTGALVTELSSASGTGLLDLAGRTWSGPSLDLAGITEDRLPPVLSPTDVRGLRPEVAALTGLPLGTPVVLGAGDGPLGNVGAGALRPGTAGLSLGTSGALRVVVDAPHVEPGSGLFCYALTEDHWVVGGAVSNGGSVVRWTESVFGTDAASPAGSSTDEAVLSLAAQVPPGSDGLTMVPYLLGERSPLWDPSIPGAYLGVRERHTRAHFVRAGVEGVALQLWAVLAQLDRVQPVTAVRATGGVFRSPLWTEVVAAALDRPMVVTSAAEGSALGAAALALLALGRASSLEEALGVLRAPDDAPTVVPDPAAVAAYREARRRLPELVSGYAAVARTLQDP